MINALLLMAPIAMLVAYISRTGLRITSEGERDARLWTLGLAALVGSACGPVAALAGLGGDIQFAAALLGAFLATGALIDRATGWAPDLIMLPCCILALCLGGATGSWDIGPLHSIALGLGIYFALNGLWMGIAVRAPTIILLPPADILALALPVMIFGITMPLAACMVVISAILILCLVFPTFGNLFRGEGVAEEVLAEAGSEASADKTVTFLAVGFPVIALSLCASFVM